ncbi:hypothetical protein OOK06_30500 [Streptomyces sp. NBC_00340]|uniref:hypothetical protein n=1 Tax=Streptomyces sp. NBC_00340 TaxID=2975716 RepID=UPI002253B372|nr:hypothetical protein [Streptomyces sp. NBC_00340]MCX5136407.1 hypothetical protein [Streptomyces sp. NBC_00340]
MLLLGFEERGQTLAGVGEVPSDDILDRVDLLSHVLRVVVIKVTCQVGVDLGGRVRVDGRSQTETGKGVCILDQRLAQVCFVAGALVVGDPRFVAGPGMTDDGAELRDRIEERVACRPGGTGALDRGSEFRNQFRQRIDDVMRCPSTSSVTRERALANQSAGSAAPAAA